MIRQADVQWDVKWIGGLLVFFGAYLLLNSMILSESPARIIYHDLVVSALLCGLGVAYARERGSKTLPWVFFALGAYLQIAPVLLWAPQAVQFLNHTVVGILTATLGGLVPFARADAFYTAIAPPRPEGWSYNPSAWNQRVVVFILCVCCSAMALYLAAYQLGYIHYMWDPVFGDEGALQVITSNLSRSFPVSDAGLGAALYAIEALCVWKGGESRWYTSPVFVLFFGILVIPVGAVSVLLIISQPLIVGHWCFWCLLTAVCMLCMIALAVDEVYAALQFLAKTRQNDPQDFWRTLWHGGRGRPIVLEKENEEGSDGDSKENEPWSTLVRGVSPTLPLILSMVIGGWLMISPTVRGISDLVAHIEDCIGPLVIAVSVIATAEVTRRVRYVNMFFGGLLCLAPFAVEFSGYELVEVMLTGILLILLSIPQGKMHERYA